jgi:glyoxylase-like metal-dependent hydrolase (beta-lactamase superfamily II)
MKTQAFPFKEIAPHTYEIGEFDCASMFLLVGSERALLIDTGMGIGDLKGFIAKLTSLPLMVCYSHNHLDHVGGAGAFDNAHIHPRDMELFAQGGGIGLSVEKRRTDIGYHAQRTGSVYPYNLDEDLSEWGPCPPLEALADGQVIDLGGRRVTVYECPGHTAGCVVFLDENTRTLFLGDALNCNLLLGMGAPGTPRFVSLERALDSLKRLRGLSPLYDRYYNGHYDYRALGAPLGMDVLPDAIAACEQIVAGTAQVEFKPPALPFLPTRPSVTVGRTRITFNPEGVHEPKA